MMPNLKLTGTCMHACTRVLMFGLHGVPIFFINQQGRTVSLLSPAMPSRKRNMIRPSVYGSRIRELGVSRLLT
jgi:hypothetical protein